MCIRDRNRRDVKKIQEYLLEHPKSTLADVSLDTGIPMRVLNVLVLENMIELNPSKDRD